MIRMELERNPLEPSVSEMTFDLLTLFGRDRLGYILLRDVEDPNSNIDTNLVSQWALGEKMPDDISENRLRVTYHAIRKLVEYEHPRDALAWFQGMKEELNERASSWGVAEDPQGVGRALDKFINE